MQKNSLAVFLVVLILFACDSKQIYDQYIPIENNQWKTSQLLDYRMNIQDTLSVNNLYLNIRNTSDYPYSNLFLFMTITDPTGKSKTDTLELTLADDNGKWLGKGVGSTFNSKIGLLRHFKFEETGIYQVEIEQAMRTASLAGITDVGIRVERLK